MIPFAWKFNSKQLLFKTLNSRMNIIETRAVLNIVIRGQTGGPGINTKVFFAVIFNLQSTLYKILNSRTNIKKVSSARGGPLGIKKMWILTENIQVAPCSVLFLPSQWTPKTVS